MRNFIAPEIKVLSLSVEDVISASSTTPTTPSVPTLTVDEPSAGVATFSNEMEKGNFTFNN